MENQKQSQYQPARGLWDFVGLGSLAEKSTPNLVATATVSADAFSILMFVELIPIVVANTLTIIVGWPVYYHQRSRLPQG